MTWLAPLLLLLLLAVSPADADSWLTHGGDMRNQRWARGEKKLSFLTAPTLTQRWAFATPADVSATPAVCKGAVYVPDWAGMLHAINATTGATIWSKNLTRDYRIPRSNSGRVPVSIATPAVLNTSVAANDLLILGVNGPAYAFAVRRLSGALVWSTELDPHPAAQISGAATILGTSVFFGTTGNELALAQADPTYECCTFIGSVFRINAANGQVAWQKLTLPDNMGEVGGYAGGGVAGSTPAVDSARRLIYVGVDRAYRVPPAVATCLRRSPTPASPHPCRDPDSLANSVAAIDVDTGNTRWFRSVHPSLPEYAVEMSPMLLTITAVGTRVRDVAVAAHKLGVVVALDRANGSLVWQRSVGPGAASGGLATDARRVFVGVENREGIPWQLLPGSAVTGNGGWVALAASNGGVLWTAVNPTRYSAFGTVPTAANGVLLVGSLDPAGRAYGLNATNGRILWAPVTGASVGGGLSVVDGCVFFGRGFSKLRSSANTTGGGPQRVLAYCVMPGKLVPPSPPPFVLPPYSPPRPTTVASPPPRPPPPKSSPPPPLVVRKSPPPRSPPPAGPLRVGKVIVVGNKTNGWDFSVAITWTVPPVSKGDILRFQWKSAHDVWVMPNKVDYDLCKFTRATKLTEILPIGDFNYTVTADPGTTVFFACGVGFHCSAAQKVAIPIV